MKKILAALLILALAIPASAGTIPKWVHNAATAGPHKLYATTPGDQGGCTYFQITAVGANITVSLHNYTRDTNKTSDDAWQRLEGVAADSVLTVYNGETVAFEFGKDDLKPEAYYTSGGTARVWAK